MQNRRACDKMVCTAEEVGDVEIGVTEHNGSRNDKLKAANAVSIAEKEDAGGRNGHSRAA